MNWWMLAYCSSFLCLFVSLYVSIKTTTWVTVRNEWHCLLPRCKKPSCHLEKTFSKILLISLPFPWQPCYVAWNFPLITRETRFLPNQCRMTIKADRGKKKKNSLGSEELSNCLFFQSVATGGCPVLMVTLGRHGICSRAKKTLGNLSRTEYIIICTYT